MAVDPIPLAEELKALRTGRGIDSADIGTRVGHVLREVCGVRPDDGPVEIRRKLVARLSELTSHLPADLALVIDTAFALDAESRLPFYGERLKLAASRIGRDVRTARRRVDTAIDQLAVLAASVTGETVAGPVTEDATRRQAMWRTERLQVYVVLDQPIPEVLELRTIVSEYEGLAELDLAVTVPGSDYTADAGAELDVDVFYGGRLSRRESETPGRHHLDLSLPGPLLINERHDIALRFRAPLQPYYVCMLRQPCDRFDLHVHFDLDRLPSEVWRLNGTFQDEARDRGPGREHIEVDGAGEANATFAQLRPGFAYGMKWSDAGR